MIEDARFTGHPVWHTSDEVCAFSDDERHFGHIMRTGNHWTVFDSTRTNEDGTGFRLLGSFISLQAAKKAVERATFDSVDEISASPGTAFAD